MMGPKDSVVTTSTSVITADGKISFELPNRPKMTGKVLAMGGDSVTTEFGPYDSVLRPGKQVTTRTTLHYKGDNATGTFTAKYADGETRAGKTSAKRTKK